MRQLALPPFAPIVSFKPGTKCALPGTPYVVQCFPTALRIFETEHSKEVVFPEIGPMSGWKTTLDLMRRVVLMEGASAKGFVRLRLEALPEGLFIKSLKGDLQASIDGQLVVFPRGRSVSLMARPSPERPFPISRLLLGCHKTPNWERVSADASMYEILPMWYLYLDDHEKPIAIPTTMLGTIAEQIVQKNTPSVLKAFDRFFHVAIDDIFVPKKEDTLHFGYSQALLPEELEVSAVNGTVAACIRSLFIAESNSAIELLPCVPDEFESGRLLQERLRSGHTIHMEWRKGRLRRLVLHAATDDSFIVNTAASFGYIRPLRTPGKRGSFKVGAPVEIRAGEVYLLDNFST